ncbi:MAG: acyl-CoA thioesterase [Bacteroidota bacterium]
MFSHETSIRVRYAETDQMGVVYHGHYFPFLESGRVEAIRSLGISYADLEKMGITMPVVEVQVKYLRPARYDDLICVRTSLPQLPSGHRIEFHQEIYRGPDELLLKAVVKLYFWDAVHHKKSDIPSDLLEKLKSFYID